jgi:hypothetical protein
MIFEKGLLTIKCVVWFSLQLWSETFLILKKNPARYCHKYTYVPPTLTLNALQSVHKVYLWGSSRLFPLHSLRRLIFLKEAHCVLCEVRNGWSYVIQIHEASISPTNSVYPSQYHSTSAPHSVLSGGQLFRPWLSDKSISFHGLRIWHREQCVALC